MGSSQATAAGHAPVSDAQKDYSFPGTTLPNGQPVINHYIQACISYGPIVGCASRSQFGTTPAAKSTSEKLKSKAHPRRGTTVPSISTEGAMKLRQHSSISPLGSLKASSSSPTGSIGNFNTVGGGGSNSRGGGDADSLNVLAASSGSPRSAFPSLGAFAAVCEQGALDLHTRNARNGKRSGVYNGVYFYILSSVPEEKVFSAHMKGLEAIDALRLPSVQVPRTAKVFFLGLTMACIELVSIHGVSRYPTSVSTVVSPSTSSPQQQVMMVLPPSVHSRVVSVIISRAYRLTGDPSIVMYETGGGSLVVVDACGLLPALAVRATALKPWHSSRFEAIIGYDFPKNVATSLQCGQVVASTTPKHSKEEFPMMRAVLNAALHYPKKKHVSISNLNFLLVGQNLGSNHHFDDAYVCTSQPLPPTELAVTSPYAIRIPKSTDSNSTFTAILFKGIIPSFVEAFDLECTSNASHFMSAGGGSGGGSALCTLADKRTFSQSAFVTLMKRCGLGIHMLGHLWTISKNKPGDNGRALRYHVGTEMLARATKRILHDTLSRTILPSTNSSGKTAASSPVSHQTVVDAVMVVFRGVAEEKFRESELVPLVGTMFSGGDGMVPRVGKDISYHSMLARVEELTGIITENGTLQSIRPFCRVAKTGIFPLGISSQEELRLCTVASKREDGMAGAATVSAVSFHRRNVARIGTVLDQLRSRAQYPADPAATLSDTATLMQMFVAMIELTLVSHTLYAPTLPVYGGAAAGAAGNSASAQNRTAWLQATVPDKRVEQYIKLSHGSEHDKMFIAHYLLLIADKLLRTPSTITQGALIVRQVLGLGLFQNSVSVHPVASRYLQEQLHRVSVEACYATNQLKEALAISKRWFRSSCVALFGGSSEAYFEATRMMMVALIRSKRKREATRVAQKQYDLAELVYGGKVSIHSVELPAVQVVELHSDVSRRVDTSHRGGLNRSGGGSPSTILTNNTAVLRIASAANDLGSLTWRHAPVCGLVHFRRAIAIYNAVYGTESKATATTTYNIGLALLRLNQFGASQKHIQAARRTALHIDDERGLVQLCDASLKSLTLISATKIQRWYRSIKYGVAKSQTTRTDTTTTFQSALSWSDELSEISSSGK